MLQNPTVTYPENGIYDVTLTVTNESGQVETITKQNYITVKESYNMQNGTITTCDAMFYDDGGPDGNYRNRRNYTLTFRPADQNRRISVNFLTFCTEADYDYLSIYDGSSTSAPEIGKYSGTNSPDTVTATNPEGTLTFHFSSDQDLNDIGWAAHVSCVDYQSVTELQNQPQVYPNPNQGTFIIKALGKTEYQLCNGLGQCILAGRFSDETQINAEPLSQGVYFLQLIGEQGIHVEKIVIEK
jgi:PKD repeat protein